MWGFIIENIDQCSDKTGLEPHSSSSHNILSFWPPNFIGPLAARFASISCRRCCFRSSRFRFASSMREVLSASFGGGWTGVNLVLLQSSAASDQESCWGCWWCCCCLVVAIGVGLIDKLDKLGIGRLLLLGAGFLVVSMAFAAFGFTSLKFSQSSPSSSSSSQPSVALETDAVAPGAEMLVALPCDDDAMEAL